MPLWGVPGLFPPMTPRNDIIYATKMTLFTVKLFPNYSHLIQENPSIFEKKTDAAENIANTIFLLNTID